MKRNESTPPEGRDQVATTFAEILQQLLWFEPRATAAVLIDSEGETVDYASSLATYYTKVAAANLRVVLDDIGEAWQKMPGGDGLTQAIIRARDRSFFVRPLADGYALVLILRRRVFAISTRAVAISACRLAKEADWSMPPEESLPWHPVEVETRRVAGFRPIRVSIGGAWERVEILGSVVGTAREKGYRCRLQAGAELTLVREPTGTWFADQAVHGLASSLGPEETAAARDPNQASTAPPGAKTADGAKAAEKEAENGAEEER